MLQGQRAASAQLINSLLECSSANRSEHRFQAPACDLTINNLTADGLFRSHNPFADSCQGNSDEQ
jgi:hypothetical protein